MVERTVIHNEAGLEIVGHCTACGCAYVSVDWAANPRCLRCDKRRIVPEPGIKQEEEQ